MKRHTLVLSILLLLGAFGSGDPSLLLSRPPVDPIQGVVREASGGVVPAARVELWSASQLVAVARTDPSGAFQLTPKAEWSEGWHVRVERLGYRSVEIPVAAALTFLEIVLEPTPLPLPGFRVEGERDFCAAREDPAAREIWELASRRHASGLDTVGIASYTHVRTDTLQGERLGGAVSGLVGAVPGQRASAPLLRLSWGRRVEREGYAFPVRRSDRERSYDSWSYPPLEADFAPHFAQESFGRLHDFHMELEDSDGWVVRFCGRRTSRPYLEGTIEIGPDTLMRRAEWRFRTSEPDEEAGGWARFAPVASGEGPPPLLPTESVTWRSLPDGEVLRRVQWYERWILAPGDSVPFLPEREAAGRAATSGPSTAGSDP